MSRFTTEILVTPRVGLLDPQGKAVRHALASLGYDSVQRVRVGKVIYLEVEADSGTAAQAQAEAMCRRLLANPVTEDFRITAAQAGAGGDETRAGTRAGTAEPTGTAFHRARAGGTPDP